METSGNCPILQWIAALQNQLWQISQTSCVASPAASVVESADGVAAAAADSTTTDSAEKAKAALVHRAATAVSQTGSIPPTSHLWRVDAAADAPGVKEHFFGSLGGAGGAALEDIARMHDCTHHISDLRCDLLDWHVLEHSVGFCS